MGRADFELHDNPETPVTLNRNTLLIGGGVIVFIFITSVFFALSNRTQSQNSIEDIDLTDKITPADLIKSDLFGEEPSSYDQVRTSREEIATFDRDTDETIIDYGLPTIQLPEDDASEERERLDREERKKMKAWASPLSFKGGIAASLASPNATPNSNSSSAPIASLTQTLAKLSLSETAKSNDPVRKEQFFEKSLSSNGNFLVNGYEAPISPDNEIKAGTTIHAALLTGINSDLPGTIVAQITRPVFDTVSGRNLLIPQGSRLLGKYDSVISFDQERVQIAWFRIIFPTGGSIDLGNMPGTDAAGYSGTTGDVDNHYSELGTGIGISTLISGLSALLSNSFSSNDELASASIQAVQEQSSSVSSEITRKFLNRQPTIIVEPGTPVQLLLTKDVLLPKYGRAS